MGGIHGYSICGFVKAIAMDDEIYQMTSNAYTLWCERRHSEAAALYRAALEVAERTYGVESAEVIEPLQGLGAAIAPPGDATKANHEQAAPLLERALRTSEMHHGAESSKNIPILRALGLTMLGLDRSEEALSHLARALKIGEATFGMKSGHLVLTLTALVECVLIMERAEDAVPYAERYLEIAEGSGTGLTWAHLTLGRCLMQAGRSDEALLHLEQARRAILDKNPQADSVVMREIASWIELLRDEQKKDEET